MRFTLSAADLTQRDIHMEAASAKRLFASIFPVYFVSRAGVLRAGTIIRPTRQPPRVQTSEGHIFIQVSCFNPCKKNANDNLYFLF